jgi:Tfp pilus assembly protein PilO
MSARARSVNLDAFKRPVVLLTAGALVLVTVLWWIFWMSPEGSKLNTQNSLLATDSQKLQTLRGKLAQVQKEAAQAAQYASYLSLFSTIVPPIPESEQLTTDLSNLAGTAHVHLTTLADDTVTVPSTGSPLGTIEVDITITGSRPNCFNFLNGLYNVSSMPRLITIDTFGPAPKAAGSSDANILANSKADYTFTIDGTAYYYPGVEAPTSSSTSTSATN